MPTFTLAALTVNFAATFSQTPLAATSNGEVVITSSEGIPRAFYTNGASDNARARTDGTFMGDIETISFNGQSIDPSRLIASRVTFFTGRTGNKRQTC